MTDRNAQNARPAEPEKNEPQQGLKVQTNVKAGSEDRPSIIVDEGKP